MYDRELANSPAFPRPLASLGDTSGAEIEVAPDQTGMTLRQYYASKAGPQALALLERWYENDWVGINPAESARALADMQFHIADALIVHESKKAATA